MTALAQEAEVEVCAAAFGASEQAVQRLPLDAAIAKLESTVAQINRAVETALALRDSRAMDGARFGGVRLEVGAPGGWHVLVGTGESVQC